MKKTKVLQNVVIIIVMLMGSVPALMTLLINVEGPFQRPEGPYWKALLIGVVSLLAVVVISYFFSRYLFRKWYNESKSIVINSSVIGLIVLLAGLISIVVGWEFNWLTGKVFGWGHVAGLSWLDFITSVPFMATIYSIIPAIIVGLICGITSLLYLKHGN